MTFFFILEYHKTYFPGPYCLNKKDGKIGNFRQKPWTNSSGNFQKGLVHGFGRKLATFETSFFRRYGPGNVFYRLCKLRSSKRRKIDAFPKWLVHGFGLKLPLFNFLFLGKVGHERVVYSIIVGNNAFLGYKNKNFKKLVHGFGSKLAIFAPFLLRQYGPGKCVL